MKPLLMLVALAGLCAPVLSIHRSGEIQPSATVSAAEELKPMLALNLEDFDGKKVDSAKYKGNIVVVDFWATWCGPCIAEIPEYNRLQEKYADKGVKLIGVTMASGEAKEVKPFISRHNMKYTVLMGDDGQAFDFSIMGFPTTYLVTSDWKVYKKFVGGGPAKIRDLEAAINTLLEHKE